MDDLTDDKDDQYDTEIARIARDIIIEYSNRSRSMEFSLKMIIVMVEKGAPVEKIKEMAEMGLELSEEE